MAGSYSSTMLFGSAEGCRRLGAQLRSQATAHAGAACVAGEAGAPSSWHGDAAGRASQELLRLDLVLSRLAARHLLLGRAVTRLGHTLGHVERQLARARSQAVAAGHTVDLGGFWAPSDSPAARVVATARAQEDEAQREMAEALLVVTEGRLPERFARAVVESVLHLPDLDGDDLDSLAWVVGLPGAADILTDGAKGRLAQHAHHGLARAAISESPFAVGAATAAIRLRPLAARAARHAGPAGTVLDFATSGRDQWQADADDGRLSRTDRVGRTVVRGALEGGSAMAGGFVGGQYGAAFGSMVCPGAGTAVGAVVGGAAGAFLATEAGRHAADAAVESVDEVVDLAGDVAGTVSEAATATGEALEDAAGAVGDTAKSLSGTLVSWR